MEASTQPVSSVHAQKLAFDNGVDLDLVIGSGKDGAITKADVQLVINRQSEVDAVHADDAPAVAQTQPADVPAQPSLAVAAQESPKFSNIMEAQKYAREQASTVQTGPAPVSDVVALPSQEEMFALMNAMKTELTELRGLTAGLIDRDSYDVDLTDAMFYIAKPNGLHWEERRVRDKRTIQAEFRATAFYGPFESAELIETYLVEKRKKREDSYIDWEDIRILSGRDARLLDKQEKADREAEYATDVSTNVLDRRVWAAQPAHDGSQAKVIGPAA